MLNFKVSAPGKVILFGEHSVVHGKSAIAGSINLRSTLSFQLLPSSETSIHFISPATNVDKYLSLSQLEDYFFESSRPRYKNNPEEFLNQLENFLQSLDLADNSQKMCFQATLFLLAAILQSRGIENLKPFSLHGETQLSIGSGLGSSASFAVCLATCFLHYTNHVLEKPTELTSEFLNEVSNFAFECEKLMHGTPSGIDNTICTYGSLLKFKREEPFKTIPCNAAMKIMLVDTRVPRSTKVLVQNVRQLKMKYPKVFDPIFEAMDEIALIGLKTVQNIMQSLNDDEDCLEDYKILKVSFNLKNCIFNKCVDNFNITIFYRCSWKRISVC